MKTSQKLSFTFIIDIAPPKDSTLLIKFFGLTEGDQLELLYKFLVEEIYRNQYLNYVFENTKDNL